MTQEWSFGTIEAQHRYDQTSLDCTAGEEPSMSHVLPCMLPILYASTSLLMACGRSVTGYHRLESSHRYAGYKMNGSRLLRSHGKSWAARVGEDGLLDVSQRPAASRQVAELLDKVVHQGHELVEDEIVYLFKARGADFDAVCAAAGRPGD